MSMRAGKAIGAGALALLLAGCGLLWAPLEDRDNPLDPSGDLVPVVRPIAPEADGYVDDIGFRDFMGPEVKVRDTIAPHRWGLLRFNLATAPAILDAAVLRLYCLAPAGRLNIYRIEESWDEGSISWGTVTGGTFRSLADAAGVDASLASTWYECDVTLQVRTMIAADKPYGFLLVPGPADVTLSSSRGLGPPVLELTGYDNP